MAVVAVGQQRQGAAFEVRPRLRVADEALGPQARSLHGDILMQPLRQPEGPGEAHGEDLEVR
eukprot:3027180-Lingulodinium_polyedra.AAC.1